MWPLNVPTMVSRYAGLSGYRPVGEHEDHYRGPHERREDLLRRSAGHVSANATWMESGDKTRLLPCPAISSEKCLIRRVASAACPA